jgi:glutamine synthetase type III
MAKNKITDLRDHLFEVIERLKETDSKESIDLEKAKAIADTAQVIINSVKVEVDFMKITGAIKTDSNFIPLPTQLPNND